MLIDKARALLDIDAELVAAAIARLAQTEHLVREDDAVYARALYDAEVRAAAHVAALITTPKKPISIDIPRAVAWFEGEVKIELADEQRAALASAVEHKVSVITGGPGTGKTTIVNGLIRILEKKNLRILLAAPTGRAAKRMQETTGKEAKTVHRLLEFDPKGMGFVKNEATPLEADVLIVDEVSMVDVVLFDHLLRAVPPEAQLVLVGDIDQLPSVGPGSVLRDLINSGAASVTTLDRIFRQAKESLIIVNAHHINRGEMPEVTAGADGDFYLIERNEPDAVIATLKELVAKRVPAKFNVDPVDDIQVLTPMNKGSLGAQNLNLELQALLNPEGPAITRGARTLRTGDKVMQLRNNYDLGVFNGDVGRIAQLDLDANTAVVRYDERDVLYEASDLDELTLAYACSIHKSQGSEYPVVILPLGTQHYVMLERNLLYTAVTRGRRLVVIVGSRRALEMAVGRTRDDRRGSRLEPRIRSEVERLRAG